MVGPGPSRRFGELHAVWACDCDGDHSHWIIHLHSNTPSRQQLNQTTNHTNKKKINQTSTPNTQKSTTEPFSHKPLIPSIPTSDDQIKTPTPDDPRGGAERVSRSGAAKRVAYLGGSSLYQVGLVIKWWWSRRGGLTRG
jgi:hypothetical protein